MIRKEEERGGEEREKKKWWLVASDFGSGGLRWGEEKEKYKEGICVSFGYCKVYIFKFSRVF